MWEGRIQEDMPEGRREEQKDRRNQDQVCYVCIKPIIKTITYVLNKTNTFFFYSLKLMTP